MRIFRHVADAPDTLAGNLVRAVLEASDGTLWIGYPGGSLLLLACVLGSLFAWHRTLGTVDVNTVSTPGAEAYYWITITFSQTLGTALGDWTADTAGLGYVGAAAIFGAHAGPGAFYRLMPHNAMAALFGALPLILQRGAGSELRRPLGLAVVGHYGCGMTGLSCERVLDKAVS